MSVCRRSVSIVETPPSDPSSSWRAFSAKRRHRIRACAFFTVQTLQFLAFYLFFDTFDFENVGFVALGPEAEENGVRFDTSERGNGNGGHVYGVGLSADQRLALIEFLKTQ